MVEVERKRFKMERSMELVLEEALGRRDQSESEFASRSASLPSAQNPPASRDCRAGKLLRGYDEATSTAPSEVETLLEELARMLLEIRSRTFKDSM